MDGAKLGFGDAIRPAKVEGRRFAGARIPLAGVKTLEYDLALYESNRNVMLKTLKALHPKVGAEVEKAVNEASDDAAKAKALFCGMFERGCNNVQKGRFGQALAQKLLEANTNCDVPEYIKLAIAHVCGGAMSQE